MHSGAGTVGWVAPEQIRRQVALVGPATDLYALGCVVFRLLTGREVFEGSTQDVLRAHKRTPVIVPRLPEGVPPAAGKFVLRLLKKKPWNRFEFAADARRSWNQIKPANASTLEDIVQGLPSLRGRHLREVARSGYLSLRSPGLVARQQERRELLDAVHSVATGSHSQELLALIGDAGVGKSRLAEWSCSEVHEHGVMLPLRARYGRTPSPLDGITGAINAHFGLTRADRSTVEHTLIALWDVAADDEEALAWVAATAEWSRADASGCSRSSGSDRQALRPRPAGASVSGHQAFARAALQGPPRPLVARRLALRFAEHLRRHRASEDRRAGPAPAGHRDSAKRDACHRPRRRLAHGGRAGGLDGPRHRSQAAVDGRDRNTLAIALPLADSAVRRVARRSKAEQLSSRCSSSMRGRAAAI